jgi:hypothetical protein
MCGCVGGQGSKEGADSKRGLHLLRAALPVAAAREAPWLMFLTLYELLDEYPLHLIEVSAWTASRCITQMNVRCVMTVRMGFREAYLVNLVGNHSLNL